MHGHACLKEQRAASVSNIVLGDEWCKTVFIRCDSDIDINFDIATYPMAFCDITLNGQIGSKQGYLSH
eukprot:4836877-Pleurochrysis_carterae.AAC.1